MKKKNKKLIFIFIMLIFLISACSRGLDLISKTEIQGDFLSLNLSESYLLVQYTEVYRNDNGSITGSTSGIEEDQIKIHFTDETIFQGLLSDGQLNSEFEEFTLYIEDLRMGDVINAYGKGGRGEFFAEKIEILRIE